jgi:hypothetical protein
MTDPRIEKWLHWFEKGVSNDIYGMHLRRFAWDRMAEIAKANPAVGKTESYYWEFQFETYAGTQAAVVRRQTDAYDSQVASLGRIIHEMSETPDILSRSWWVGLWGRRGRDEEKERWKSTAEKAWNENYAGHVGEHFDPKIALADLAELLAGAEKVRCYVDQHIAHFDASTIPRESGSPEVPPPEAPKGSIPTLSEVHEAIDLVGRMFQKYGNLLTAASWVDLTPVLQHDWEAVFRVPWIEPATR